MNPNSDHQENYKLFFDNAPDAVILIDQYNLIQFWNPKAEAIFGWSSAEVLGKILTDVIVPQEYREAHNNGMKRYLATGEVRVLNKTIEVPSIHRNGHQFYISLTISKIEKEGVASFLAFIRDITEQRSKQAQLDTKTLELERSNIQLQEFAYVASHDLKEPLRKITTFSNLVISSQDNILSEKTKTYLHKIEAATQRMQQLIDGILLYSTVGTESKAERCNLELLLREVLSNLEGRIRELNARITSDGLPQWTVIPVQLQQLFQNLISNALKFVKEGQHPNVAITHAVLTPAEVADKKLQPAAAYLQINVQDNGIGFDMNASDKIFGLFQRLHGKSAYEGSGLGLAICKRIAEAHGGTIYVTSEATVGSTFTVILPQNAV